MQSAATLHASPGLHAGHAPPQSSEVSVPFLTPSLHDGAWHAPAPHTREMQSLPTRRLSFEPLSMSTLVESRA